MKNNQKGHACRQAGFAPILLIAIIAVIAVTGHFLFVNKGNIAITPSNTATTQNQQIQNDNDLNAAANDLDNTDTGQIDTQLNQLSSEASAF